MGSLALAALRAASPFLVLAALPLVLLAANDTWIWDSPSYRDTNVYVGYFRHYLEFREPFVSNYKSSRLPFVLPGVALYRWLPPALAHHLLFLLFLTGGACALFVWARRRFGAHAAFATAAAMTVFTFSHAATSYHNQAAVAYFVAAIALVDQPEKLPVAKRALLAGAAFALAVLTDIFAGALAPVVALRLACTRPTVLEGGATRAVLARLGVRAGAALLGAVFATATLGGVNAALGGPFVFFLDQLNFSLHAGTPGSGNLSQVPIGEFVTRIVDFPWLVLPAVALVGIIARFAARARRHMAPAAAIDAASFIVAIAAAVAIQLRGFSLLDHPHFFHVFFAPTFLALAAIVGDDPSADAGPPGALFVAAVSALLLAPLCLAGAPLSRWLASVARTWPAAAHGVPFSLGIAAACGALLPWLPVPGRAKLVAAAGAFGVINAITPDPWQPAYLYQLGDRCAFRRQTFDALLAADDAISAFDPDSQARWLYGAVATNETAFDGRGWCTLVPVDAASRDLLLSHYFYTAAENIYGYRPPPRPAKLVVVARDAARADALVAGFLEAQPPATTVSLRIERTFLISESAVVLRGYEVARPANE
jgi:hypothetical protein